MFFNRAEVAMLVGHAYGLVEAVMDETGIKALSAKERRMVSARLVFCLHDPSDTQLRLPYTDLAQPCAALSTSFTPIELM